MTETQALQTLGRIRATYFPFTYDPEIDITVEQAAEAMGASDAAARRFLKREVKEKRMVENEARIEGRTRVVYRDVISSQEAPETVAAEV